MSQNSNNGGGIGFVGLLTILFIALKLTGHIDWGWWWILSPLWITVGALCLLIVVVGGIALMMNED